MKRLIALALLLAFVVVFVVGLGPASAVAHAQAGQKAARAVRYDVELDVLANGDLFVRETQQIAFQGGPFEKGSRRLSLRRVEAIGDVRVEEPGQPYRPGGAGVEASFTFAVQEQGRSGRPDELLVEWWFPETRNATRTFLLTYRVAGAIRVYPEGDQLRWQAIPADHGYPIEQSTVTLRLPVDVLAANWMLDSTPSRLTAQSAVASGGSAAVWQAANLPPGQAYEIRAQWPHGIVNAAPPAWQHAADAADWRQENLRPVLNLAFGAAALLIPIFGGLGIVLHWYTRGRDPSVGVVPPELDHPPSDLPPGLVGTVVDGGADAQDVIATVLDLAARGVLTITEIHDPSLAGSQRDFLFELAKPDARGLRPYEHLVLRSFFARERSARLSRLGEWFQEGVPRIGVALYREAVAAGLFVEDPEAVRRRYWRIGSLLMVGGVIFGIGTCGLAPQYGAAIPWPFFSIALVGLMVRLSARSMPKRTPLGAIEAARWRAYARYLGKAPPDALATRDVPHDTTVNGPAAVTVGHHALLDIEEPEDPRERKAFVFERTLPYAVALGIDRTWVEKFANVETPAPRWFQPPVVAGGPVGPMWGGPWIGGGGWVGTPGGRAAHPAHRPAAESAPAPGGGSAGPGGPQDWSDQAAGGLERASGSLADLLNRASEVLSRGGGSDWSGGGFGGGFGGSGGGGSDFS